MITGAGVAARSCVLAQCRPGFEGEVAAELAQRCGLGTDPASEPTRGAGFVVFAGTRAGRTPTPPPVASTVFARQILTDVGALALPRAGRVEAILADLRARSIPVSGCWLEMPDTNDGKSLSALLRPLGARIDGALAAAGALRPDAATRFHVFFVDGENCYTGLARHAAASPWPMGIARLSMPAGAPSRSTLKLAEAWLTFLSPEERERWLRPGMRAIDLGAAPGGWAWQFVRRGIRVVAVDNGRLAPALAADPLVEHLRCDAFGYRPRRPVDWMVCDIVDKPARVTALVAEWITSGWTRRVIFNLKLPMKARWEAVELSRGRLAESAREAGLRVRLALRQLYHDREEITGFIARN